LYSPDGSRILTLSGDATTRQWELPRATDKPAAYFLLEFQIRSGTRLDDVGVVRALTPDEWKAKKKEFRETFGEEVRVPAHPGPPMGS